MATSLIEVTCLSPNEYTTFTFNLFKQATSTLRGLSPVPLFDRFYLFSFQGVQVSLVMVLRPLWKIPLCQSKHTRPPTNGLAPPCLTIRLRINHRFT